MELKQALEQLSNFHSVDVKPKGFTKKEVKYLMGNYFCEKEWKRLVSWSNYNKQISNFSYDKKEKKWYWV